jgi:hypothetical protein
LEPHGHQRSGNLPDTALRGKQVELRRRIACILDLEANTEAIEVLAHRGRNGGNLRAGADDEQICK